MNAVDLKEYIVNNNKTVEILESLGCHKIRINQKDIRCALPEHNNPTSVSVDKNSLKIIIFSDDMNLSGDIFTFIMKLKNISFPQSVKYIHELLKLPYTYQKQESVGEKKNITSVFLKAKGLSRLGYKQGELQTIQLEDNDDYLFLPHVQWIRDGILPFAIKKFNIGYDIKSKRILIPHRLWYGDENDYVGLIGRTTVENYDLLDIPKYCSMHSEPYLKTLNIYGLQENYASIQKAGYVVVYEAEKSVLKRYSRLDETGVALCGHNISKEQVKILISLDVDIIIAMDDGIDSFEIRHMCEQFYKIRRIFYIIDKTKVLLINKQSPADLTEEQYQFLFKNKIEYNEYEHQQYIEELQRRGGIIFEKN